MALTPEEELELLELEEQDYQESLSKKPEVSKVDSAVRGGLQGATLGFADEIGGLVQSGLDYFGGGVSDVNKQLAAQGFKGDIGPTSSGEMYKQSRDENRMLDAQAQKDNPITYGASNIAGSILPSLIPGAQIAKGSSALKAAGVGAGYGALQGAGNTEEIASQQALEDIISGGAIGGVTGGALQALSNKFSKVKPEDIQKSLKDIANSQAARALGAERGTIKKLGADQVEDIGRYALDNDLLTPFSNVDDVIAKNEAVKNRAGKTMGNVFSKIDEEGASTFNPTVAAKRMENELGGFWRDPINRGETNQFDNILESIKNRGVNDMPLQEAQLLKEKIGKTANWKNNLVVTDKEKMAREAYDIVNKYIDESADVASDLMNSRYDLKSSLQNARKDYSGAKGAASLLENKQAREQGNKMFGLTDTILGAGGVAAAPFTGGLSVAPVALVGGKKLFEKYGSQTAALGFDKLGDILKNNPQIFGKFQNILQQASQRGPQALGAAHFILQSKSPEYREQIKNMRDGGEQ